MISVVFFVYYYNNEIMKYFNSFSSFIYYMKMQLFGIFVKL